MQRRGRAPGAVWKRGAAPPGRQHSAPNRICQKLFLSLGWAACLSGQQTGACRLHTPAEERRIASGWAAGNCVAAWASPGLGDCPTQPLHASRAACSFCAPRRLLPFTPFPMLRLAAVSSRRQLCPVDHTAEVGAATGAGSRPCGGQPSPAAQPPAAVQTAGSPGRAARLRLTRTPWTGGGLPPLACLLELQGSPTSEQRTAPSHLAAQPPRLLHSSCCKVSRAAHGRPASPRLRAPGCCGWQTPRQWWTCSPGRTRCA